MKEQFNKKFFSINGTGTIGYPYAKTPTKLRPVLHTLHKNQLQMDPKLKCEMQKYEATKRKHRKKFL